MLINGNLLDSDLHLLGFFVLPFLYAETHYRFKYFFSYLKKNEPELIIDIPSRIKKGCPMPILLIIKDADKYPVKINSLELFENDIPLRIYHINKAVNQPYSEIIKEFSSEEMPYGDHEFLIRIRYHVNGKERICQTDNHRGTSHKPLKTHFSEDSLPAFKDCIYGEMHCHSNYTSDQVEFGASLYATSYMAKSQGLEFVCITDHSYDLDDFEDNYLINDPNLNKWNKFKSEVKKVNTHSANALLIPGEEVTVRNSNDQNVHLLVLNSEQFFPGSGDSGEKWFNTYSESSISDITNQTDPSALYFAAHPAESPPFLQKIFIRRGEWHENDCHHPGLHGLQFINGGENMFKRKGLELWKKQLLSGNKLIGLAGNDAHGNFSVFRQVGFPFFTMRENEYHLFGKWRTGVYMENEELTVENTLNQIRRGNCFLTNGPAVQMRAQDYNSTWRPIGSLCQSPTHIQISVKSTKEFSVLQNCSIILGDLMKGEECTLFTKEYEKDEFEDIHKLELNTLPDEGYFRSELRTKDNYEAISNPIWFKCF
jgi:hypothetical protein